MDRQQVSGQGEEASAESHAWLLNGCRECGIACGRRQRDRADYVRFARARLTRQAGRTQRNVPNAEFLLERVEARQRQLAMHPTDGNIDKQLGVIRQSVPDCERNGDLAASQATFDDNVGIRRDIDQKRQVVVEQRVHQATIILNFTFFQQRANPAEKCIVGFFRRLTVRL